MAAAGLLLHECARGARRGGVKIYCASCETSCTELPDDTKLSPDFHFTCKDCHGPDHRVRGLSIAHDPRLDHSSLPEGTTARPPRREEVIPKGYQLDRHAPKPMKSGPIWSRSDEFLQELVADRSGEEKERALVTMRGRWRRSLTFDEIAGETNQSPGDVRKMLSVFRTKGNQLWERKERAAAKHERNRLLSARAGELFGQGLTVRQVSAILKCSVGRASELRAA